MADIKLGQSIVGSLASSDAKLNGSSYDEYNISGLDTFRQVKISLNRPSNAGNTIVKVVNAETGVVLNGATSSSGTLSLTGTSFPGTNYKIQVIGEKLGDYTLSLADGGRATSLVSTMTAPSTGDIKVRLGTIGASGVFTPLASSVDKFSPELLSDIALAPNGQLYGVGHPSGGADMLYKINPNIGVNERIQGTKITNPNGSCLVQTLNALEFATDNKLYSIGSNSAKLYQIDVKTSVATSIADLPKGFVGSGDLVFDAPNNRFLATSKDTATSDSLWQIPLANPTGATKIGQIGFLGVLGIDFENGQLTGFSTTGTGNTSSTNRIRISPNSGVGTLDRAITGDRLLGGISGASTILGATLNPVSPAPAPTMESKAPGLTQQKTIDLSNTAGKKLKADITTKGDAAYNNNIGFYVVQDALLGTIKLSDGSFLKPGDANYALEAAKSAILPAGKIDSQLNRDITGGKMYAPIVIAQGSLTDFITKNPTNGGGKSDIHAYVNYVAGNTDKVDHFRVLGNNSFGVEDMYGGGDRDYNDIVCQLTIKS
jgi:Domain of unknown function (DUF4114)